MRKDVKVPEISENVASGKVVEILVDVGDHIEADAVLLELETEKAVVEIPSPYAGQVSEILAEHFEDVLAFLERDMIGEEGACYASLDADSGGEEGTYYVWTPAQLTAAVGPEDGPVLAALLGVTDGGNFVDHSDPDHLKDQNVLFVAGAEMSEAELAALEPEVRAVAGLLSPRTAVLDAEGAARAYAHRAAGRGAPAARHGAARRGAGGQVEQDQRDEQRVHLDVAGEHLELVYEESLLVVGERVPVRDRLGLRREPGALGHRGQRRRIERGDPR